MGMRINTGSGIDRKLVDQLIEIERLPIKSVEARKTKLTEEQKLFGELRALVADLGTNLTGLRNRSDFFKMKFESSQPQILDGVAENSAPPGSYEMEVLSTAKTHKLLADSFPDKDKTSVGFGYMSIELDDGTLFDIDIPPEHSTLQDVATLINDAQAGARAIVMNTKENLEDEDEENYRLLVISEKSGKAAQVYIDPDSSYMEFKEQVRGRNLHLLFEDVPAFNDTNTVTELIPGVVFNVKQAVPGTKITVTIDYDAEKTLEAITKFVESYNKVNNFIDQQFQVDPETNHAGILSKDNSLKTLRRSLQMATQFSIPELKYKTLAEIGITTDAKNGALKIDEAKAKQCLSEDYVNVAKLFIQSDAGEGIGARMSDAVRNLQNIQSGVIPSKEREYKKILANFDKEIAVKERLAAQKAEGIKRKFTALEQLVSGLNAQGQAMQQRLGGGGG